MLDTLDSILGKKNIYQVLSSKSSSSSQLQQTEDARAAPAFAGSLFATAGLSSWSVSSVSSMSVLANGSMVFTRLSCGLVFV